MSGKARAGLRFASAETNESLLQDAIHRLETRLRPQLGGAAPDLVVVFFSPHFSKQAAELRDELQLVLNPRILIGCSAEGVLGAQAELEGQPAISLLAASLPQAEIMPFVLKPEQGWAPLTETYPDIGTYYGLVAADLDAVVDCIRRLGQLGLDFPEIEEAEINPLLVFPQGKGALALDGRVIRS